MSEVNRHSVEEDAGSGLPSTGLARLVLGGVPIEIAKDRRADLIVLGSHGRTGIERLLMGSVTERVIVLASCPVLVVKGK